MKAQLLMWVSFNPVRSRNDESRCDSLKGSHEPAPLGNTQRVLQLKKHGH